MTSKEATDDYDGTNVDGYIKDDPQDDSEVSQKGIWKTSHLKSK